MQAHDPKNSHDLISHLINQHQWAEVAMPTTDLFVVHRELHGLKRLDERTNERYEKTLKRDSK